MMELVIGGSGSGKSAYAETAVCRCHRISEEETGGNAPLYYIADMIPYGKETERKIENHRKMRAGKGFTTLEWYVDLPGKIAEESAPSLKGSGVLLECVSNLTANEMYASGGAQETGKDTVESITQGVRMLKEMCEHLVVVTNDVFRESVPDSEEMSAYKDNLGRINCALAEMADRVTEVVYGIPIRVKDNAPDGESGIRAGNFDSRQRGTKRGRSYMKFVTGGACQGKLNYAKERYPDAEWTDGDTCPLQEIESCEAVDHFHLFVRRWMQEGRSPQELTDTILNRDSDIIIVCDEIGCGLVPVDAFEREYRESVGRICTELVKHAEEVHRVTCGVGVRLI